MALVHGQVVLGIDPGTHRTGFGVLESRRGRLRALAYGVISTSPQLATAARLLRIHMEVAELVRRYQPHRAAVERLFLGRSWPSALAVGQARGVVLLALAQAGLEVEEYTPSQVKTAVVGYGRAEKAQVQAMVRRLFGLEDDPRPDDAADALAVALCAAQHGPPWVSWPGAEGEARE
jgi:crossover junction endodeoxyribonuclease RuvC